MSFYENKYNPYAPVKRKATYITGAGKRARPVLTRQAGPSYNIGPSGGPRGFLPLAVHRGRGIRGETKAVDFPTTSSSFTLNAAAGNLATLNLVQAGSSFFNRIGRKIAMQSLYINGLVSPAAFNVGLVEEYLRVLVVYDMQTNGATPIWSDVVQATTQNNAQSSLTLDGMNLNNRDRFRILLDKRFHMPEAPLVAGALIAQTMMPTACETTINEFRKLGNLETQYKADSSPSVIGDVSTGAIFILSQGTVGGQYNLTWTARLRYTDN